LAPDLLGPISARCRDRVSNGSDDHVPDAHSTFLLSAAAPTAEAVAQNLTSLRHRAVGDQMPVTPGADSLVTAVHPSAAAASRVASAQRVTRVNLR